jgi:Leucine-rich repeat (LRR) protein
MFVCKKVILRLMRRSLTLISLLLLVSFHILAKDKPLSLKKLSKKKVFTKFEDAVSKSNKVYSLYIFDRELTTDDYDQIKNMPNLQSVTFMFCKFTAKPEFLGELKNLQVLNINYCELKELPKTIGTLKNLISVDLSGNDLTSLPAEFGSLKKLISLNVFLNKLETLPMEMDSLDSLRVINISKNQLYRLPDVITKLQNLEKLDVSYNPIYCLGADVLDVAEEFKKLKKCEKLRKLLLFSNNVIPESFKSIILKNMPLGSLVLFK